MSIALTKIFYICNIAKDLCSVPIPVDFLNVCLFFQVGSTEGLPVLLVAPHFFNLMFALPHKIYILESSLRIECVDWVSRFTWEVVPGADFANLIVRSFQCLRRLICV